MRDNPLRLHRLERKQEQSLTTNVLQDVIPRSCANERVGVLCRGWFVFHGQGTPHKQLLILTIHFSTRFSHTQQPTAISKRSIRSIY